MKLLNYICIACYCLVRPLLGPAQCRFEESCGTFAMRQLKEEPIIIALKAIIKRVVRCTPWGS